MKPQFKIGTKFLRHSAESKDVETVVEIYTTTNSTGGVVKLRYVCSHEYMGQEVVDYDVPQATIARSELV